ncbi:hypothetical protein Tco_0479421 [Tanacetum coccineum]
MLDAHQIPLEIQAIKGKKHAFHDSDDDKEAVNDGPKALVFQIWDFSTHLKALEESETNISKDATTVSNQTSLVKFTGHKDEGIHYYEFHTV